MQNLSNENVIHIKKDGIEYIKFRKLLEYKDVQHCFTLKPLNFAKYDDYEKDKNVAKEDYIKIENELNIQHNEICRPKQTHTDRIEIIGDTDAGIYNPKFNDVDGLVTNINNKALTLSFADCTPLLFYDPTKRVIANIHSGWKGTYQEIGSKTVRLLFQKYNCNPNDIICCIGPHIRSCHFEVKRDVKDMFYNKFRALENIDKYIKGVESKYYIDTLGINIELLLKLGLKEGNIIDSKICTVCNSNICHSYRTDMEFSGRSIALIELR